MNSDPGDMTVSGPMANGNFVLQDADGVGYITVKNDPAQANAPRRRVAAIVSRAQPMRLLLERLRDALRGDDDGTRFKVELDAIALELSIQDARGAGQPDPQPPAPPPAPKRDLAKLVEAIKPIITKEENNVRTRTAEPSQGVRVPHVRPDYDPFRDDPEFAQTDRQEPGHIGPDGACCPGRDDEGNG